MARRSKSVSRFPQAHCVWGMREWKGKAAVSDRKPLEKVDEIRQRI